MKIYIDDGLMTIAEFQASKNLTVGGNLHLSGTAITALPEGLTVGGYLDLSGTAITALPEGLTVGGSLYLSETAITALPEGLTVGGNLDLRGTAITALPEGLKVGRSLLLSGTAITALPEGLTVGGYLLLRGTKIKNVVKGGEDSRGYEFIGVWMKDGFRILAGCRNFTEEQALKHWTDKGNVEVLAIVEKMLKKARQMRPELVQA